VDRDSLLTLSVALGMARAFQATVQQSLVPLLVPAKHLLKALALSSTGMQRAVIGGPALGGLIYVVSAHVVYAICALLFAVSAGLFMSMRHEHVPPATEPATWRAILAGFHFLWQRPQILGAVSLDPFAVLLSGAADMVNVVIRQSLVQLDTPNEMRGRVSAVNSIFIGASNQLNKFESGATAAPVGPVASVALGELGTLLVAALWMRWFPTSAKRDQSQETKQASTWQLCLICRRALQTKSP